MLVAMVVTGGALAPSQQQAQASVVAEQEPHRGAAQSSDAAAGRPGRTAAPPGFDGATVLVRFAPETTKETRARIADEAGATEQQVVGAETHVLKVKHGTVDHAIRRLRAQPQVQYAEPNYVVRPDVVPDDPSFGELWGLRNTGQMVNGLNGTPGAGIDAPSAWNVTTGSRNVVVGVIDSGLDTGHPDLAPNVWSNPGLVNGCGPGTHGYNFVSRNCFPSDDLGHGSHVAGTIGAAGNDGIGVTGVNWTTSIMSLKFIRPTGSGLISDAVAAIDFAVSAKVAGVNVRVLNASWGGSGRSQALLDVIRKAAENDILIVASAGNGGGTDVPHFPCNFRVENLLCVGASDHDDNLASFSNSGATVDLAAPGTDILSTRAGGGHRYLNGTSMATPHV
ncbi:MAG: S8 family peptidase, partial [Nocardioidaceae bacterium]